MAAPTPQSQPPALMEELVEEILLRLPALIDLVHVALVCKRWCHLVTDPGFRRRFCQFHRTPPMLGFIVRRSSCGTHFLSTSSFRPSSSDAGCRKHWYPLDARHGRILFLYKPSCADHACNEINVWTPATGELHKLPKLWLPCSHNAYWNAALLCGTPGCNHMECPSDGPFTVVLVGENRFSRSIHAYVYSSEADEWSQPTSFGELRYVQHHCTYSALVGNALYFPLSCNSGILEYNLAKKELSSVIALPPICNASTHIVLMSVEDDGLGIAMVNDDFFLYIWLRESAPTPCGRWEWRQHRVVDLKSFLSVSVLSFSPYIVAAVDAVGVFVIRIRGNNGVFVIDLKSGRAWKESEANGFIYGIIPYISFCTPALRAATNASNNA